MRATGSVLTICEKCSFEQIELDSRTTENSTLKVWFLDALMVGRMVDIGCKLEGEEQPVSGLSLKSVLLNK